LIRLAGLSAEPGIVLPRLVRLAHAIRVAAMHANSTDTELVRAAKTGDLAAFEELTTRHEQRIYSLAYRILQNPHDAEDVTQQAFLSAVEHLAKFREESSFATWLYRIATFAALKVIRKRKGLDTVSLEEATEPREDYDSIPHPEYIADWKQSPEQLVERNETRRLLDEALAQLDEKHRVVFLLRDVEGLSVRETAEALRLTEANVKMRLLRARLQLREQLTRVLGDPATRIERGHHHHE
jgi:RNA polymerase sigma-70 factor (ECF subfamily)